MPFKQENVKENTQNIGTGLGLPIVKSIVDSMNGKLTVNSEPQVGTEYTFEISTPVVDESIKISDKSSIDDQINNSHILLVEDNEMNIIVAKKLLKSKGSEVTIARNGSIGVELFNKSEEGYFGAILMDVRMPVMDGLTAARNIRALQRRDAKTVPIIAMTADAFTEEQKKSYEAGMNYHLAKPVNPSLLFEVLNNYLRKG